MKSKNILILVSICLIIMILVSTFLSFKLSELQSENSALKVKLTQLKEENNVLNLKLKNQSLEMSQIKDECNFLRDYSIKKEILKKETETKVQYNKSFFDKFSFCVVNNSLNLACISYYLRMLNFSYKPDQGDSLEKTNEFIKNKGGDCEDWSYFFLSLVNYYGEKGINKVKFLVRKVNKTATLFKINRTNYVVQNFTYEEYPLKDFVMICYKINTTLGHCQNAIVDSMKNLKGVIIEPQNAEFDGTLKGFKKINQNKTYPIFIIMDKYLILMKKWDYLLVG